ATWPKPSPSPKPAPFRPRKRRSKTCSPKRRGAPACAPWADTKVFGQTRGSLGRHAGLPLQEQKSMRTLTYAAALETAMAEEMRRDERVCTMATAPSGPLLAEFRPARVRRTPISEAALTGIAVGAAGSGYRPVVNWRSVTFSFVAFDQIVNQASKIHYMFGGQREFPIVFRAFFLNGSRSAAQHSQTGYAMYAHLAGLKIVLPSCASDALGLL